jgi:hypothetical protein
MMIKIPFLTVIIFFILCCVYNMHYSNALEPPIKVITSYRNIVTTEAPEEASAPTSYHKKRFSLYYRARLRNAL